MPTAQLIADDLLDPITTEQPAGADLRWTPEWDRIKEARRADDGLDPGRWVRKERKTADWRTVQGLATDTLRHRSKDLQLALWLAEANMNLYGFAGLRDGLRVARELIVRYWDKGLYPSMEDGPEDRAGPFEWLNNKLVDSMTAIPITARNDGGQDYSFNDLLDARRVGSETSWKRPDGEIDEGRKKSYDTALAGGRISLDMYNKAVRESPRDAYEELSADFQQTYDEFKALESVIDEKFGEAAPNLAVCRSALKDILDEFRYNLEKRRKEQPDREVMGAAQGDSGNHPDSTNPFSVRVPLSVPDQPGSQMAGGGSWRDAELLIGSGQVEKGLAEMTRLAARETTGRNRFQRKLMLAEVCLASKRDRLARSILEELAEQIDKFQLETWESSELISSVWTRLYKLYKQGDDTSDLERADKLYQRLCRLDPWQALGCSEG